MSDAVKNDEEVDEGTPPFWYLIYAVCGVVGLALLIWFIMMLYIWLASPETIRRHERRALLYKSKGW